MPASVVGEGRTDARDVIQSDALFNVAKSTHSIKSAISSSPREDPLAAHSYSKGTHPTVTGEEDEDVSAELKGAKLFIKRGEREFSDGILGHVKLLAHRESGAQRLLFRREPVWKVSMSVRLRPAVRCTFDEEQAVLRVVLKELVDGKEQVVVYVLKRGKAPKGDFREFACAVVESSQRLAARARAPLIEVVSCAVGANFYDARCRKARRTRRYYGLENKAFDPPTVRQALLLHGQRLCTIGFCIRAGI
ncbi:hypothetical protein A0H81_06267 [Grifola frondosa]|uniref:RanBD1 domain-containing protein n=1 Tax=Grifola frondosa TaxID=5627 RepID=A0A1C7MGD4_GRIFR|nr:hypothetical protein A0H81_06267 [Grifola frondosa]